MKTKIPAPRCHKCGATTLTATSSQQMRIIKGKKRQVADVACDHCGHTWWSVHPAIKKAARALDAARKGAD